mgnify:CR=1 FL=1
MYYVYVLQSQIDGRLYKGLTQNLNNRLEQHNKGKTKSTKAFRPWKVVYYEKFHNRSEARKREKFLKSGKGRELIRQIIDNKTSK